MVTQESAFRQERAPVHEMWDVLYGRNSMLERPDDAYYFACNQAADVIRGYYQDDQPVTEQSQADLTYRIALENQFARSTVSRRVPEARVGRQATFYAAMHGRLDEKGVDAEILSTVEAANALSPEETWEYFLGQLDGYEAYLKGDLPTHPNQTASSLKMQDASHYMDLAEALWVSSRYVMQDAPTEEYNSRSDRLNEHLIAISNLFLDANKVGLATGFGGIISGAEGQNKVFATKLAAKMHEIRLVEGDDNFRQLYNYAAQTLRGSQLRHLMQQLPKEETPLIFGGEHEILYPDSESPLLAERFEEGELAGAMLSDGRRILLPIINYRHRTILGYGTERESEIFEAQTGVNYETLPEEAKAAVEIAINAEEHGLLDEETKPRYKRLAFWADEEQGDLLYSVIFRKGRGRLMNHHPDHHGLLTTDNERKLDFPVRSAEAVKDTYMVVPNDDSYMYLQTFTDATPNLFAAGAEEANAFWIMGNPRTIHSESDNRLMKDTNMGLQPKYVIVPIRYYKVEEDFETPDPAQN